MTSYKQTNLPQIISKILVTKQTTQETERKTARRQTEEYTRGRQKSEAKLLLHCFFHSMWTFLLNWVLF